MKAKNLLCPWITKGIKKSSKRKQTVRKKIEKQGLPKMKKNTKIIRNYLKRLK